MYEHQAKRFEAYRSLPLEGAWVRPLEMPVVDGARLSFTEAEGAALARAPRHEVVAPHVVLVPAHTPVAGVGRRADPPAFTGFPAYLKPFLLPQPMYPLDVHTP